MSGLPHDFYTPPAVNTASSISWRHEDNDVDNTNADISPPTAAKPLSGPGTSRQTRRLQLRNAGFRAAAVPTRKVTPKSMSSGTNWSSMSGIMSGSDAENMSPSTGTRVGSVKVEKRRSSGILQEIGNSGTLTRSKKSAKPRVSSGRLFGAEIAANNYDAVYADSPLSPPPPPHSSSHRNTLRAKSMKTRAKVNKTRRSVSGEARMYIDHLEAELASAQAQLQAINSPSVTREHTSKMRSLNHETRQLQEDIAEWEAKYEIRVQEIVDEHFEVEHELRQQIRKLEQDVEETQYRFQELQTELEATNQNMQAVEQANVQLERRLEIMGDLLAESPGKIDLHAVTPGMGGRRHQRPKSMLPRFPTASSLVASPERMPRTQPTSPMMTFTDGLDHSGFEVSDLASDAESVFSCDATVTGGSITSLASQQTDSVPNFNHWTLQAMQSAKARPARRMRRFGPGSHGPKPLILPSTSHCGQMPPASAPPLERSETTPVFSFPCLAEEHRLEDGDEGEDESPSSLAMSRRRASTTADLSTLARLEATPFLLRPPEMDGMVGEESMLSVEQYSPSRCPASAETSARNLSSLGSVTGRNLMDELCAVKSHDGVEDRPEPSSLIQEDLSDEQVEDEETMLMYGKEVQGDAEGLQLILGPSDGAAAEQGLPALMTLRHQSLATTGRRSRSNSTHQRQTSWDRLRMLFSDLWRSPLALAQHLVQTAQARRRLPEPLRNVQWWLVGVLLGPMARRRMLSTPVCCSEVDVERQPLLRAYSAPAPSTTAAVAEDEGLVYGTMYTTPPASPTLTSQALGQDGRISGKGKKRSMFSQHAGTCPHQHGARSSSKHSPWVWLKFSITLAFAVGVAFKDGPASLLRSTVCGGCRRSSKKVEEEEELGKGSEDAVSLR